MSAVRQLDETGPNYDERMLRDLRYHRHVEVVTTRLTVPVEIPPMIEVLQWHRAHDQDPAHSWLRTELKEAVCKVFGRTRLAASA